MQVKKLLDLTVVNQIPEMELRSLGCGDFRAGFQIINNKQNSKFEGDVIKIPLKGVPESTRANRLEMRAYDTAPTELKSYMADAKTLLKDDCLIMEFVNPIDSGTEIPHEIKEIFNDNISDIPLTIQGELDLRPENFGTKNGQLLLYDYPFGEI